MAHGNPRLNICFDCDQYTLVSRFSANPKCPICGKESKQTTKDKIKERYHIGFFYEWSNNFDSWVDISQIKNFNYENQ